MVQRIVELEPTPSGGTLDSRTSFRHAKRSVSCDPLPKGSGPRRYTVARTGDRETKVSTWRQIASRPRTRRQGSNTPTSASTPSAALAALARVPVSLHCWQGDDVGGFENFGESLGGGIAATGNYPGTARTPDELRRDAAKALSLIPGTHRFNLHAFYGEFGGKRVDRDAIAPEHFAGWIDWAKSLGIGLDFNPTFFSHPKAADNFTLAHPDARRPRSSGSGTGSPAGAIGAAMGEALGTPCVTNLWIPDGMKDTPVDRAAARASG